jgi:hypothetical protein
MIVMLLTSKDEGDVLSLHLRHHLAWGVDHVAVADNRSTDDTQDRLRAFGDAVSTEVFDDFGVRQDVRMRLLTRIQEKTRGSVAWAGVSDTDEFFWHPGAKSIRELLAAAPPEIVCVTFHQKLFLPTESDPATGPVYARQTWRTTSSQSPLHTSYTQGKSFYRTSWLRRITHEHRCPEVPHAEWGPPEPVVHHYMIRDEDQFVLKVTRLTAWQPRTGLRSRPWYHRLRRALRMKPVEPHVSGFKKEWWNAYARGGEPGLRAYYRTRYRIQTADLPARAAAGDLVRDTSFAEFRAGLDGGAAR